MTLWYIDLIFHISRFTRVQDIRRFQCFLPAEESFCLTAEAVAEERSGSLLASEAAEAVLLSRLPFVSAARLLVVWKLAAAVGIKFMPKADDMLAMRYQMFSTFVSDFPM